MLSFETISGHRADFASFNAPKPRPQEQRIRSGAGLNVLVRGPDGEPLARSKDLDLVTLCRESQASAAPAREC